FKIRKRKKSTAAFAIQKSRSRHSVVSQSTTESSNQNVNSLLEIEVMTQTVKIPMKGTVIDGIRVKRIGTTQKKHSSALLRTWFGTPEEKIRKPNVAEDQVNMSITPPPPIYHGENRESIENRKWTEDGNDNTGRISGMILPYYDSRNYETNEIDVHEQPEHSNPFLGADVEELEYSNPFFGTEVEESEYSNPFFGTEIEELEYSNPFFGADVEELDEFVSDFVDASDSNDTRRTQTFGQFNAI
ncbi:14314_t:CDS:1, partial [Ambispora leptoticha]